MKETKAEELDGKSNPVVNLLARLDRNVNRLVEVSMFKVGHSTFGQSFVDLGGYVVWFG